MKSPDKLVKIMELRAKGCSMEDIGREMGVTRQTVSAYLRTPEAQAIATQLQESLLSTLQSALTAVDKAIKGGDNKIARDIAVNLGKMVLSQTPQATESKPALKQEDRERLIERIQHKLPPSDSNTLKNTTKEGEGVGEEGK